MGWKRQVLAKWDQNGLADADTSKSLTLPKALIACILITLFGTGGSGTIALDTDPTMITRVKVKTKKGYQYDATGTQIRAIARKICGTIPTVVEATGAHSELNVPIYFGRKPRDRRLMLDLTEDNIRSLELNFGTLIATTAFATTTAKLTISVDYWVGSKPSGYKGFIGWKEVEDKATGTGKGVFDLFKAVKVAGLLIEVATITTVRQVTLSDMEESFIWGKMNWRDLLNIDNWESDKATAETTLAIWAFWDDEDDVSDVPDLSKVGDPILSIERGATTTVTSLVQGILYD